MKTRFLASFVILLTVWFCSGEGVLAVTAYPYSVRVNQKDGTSITVIMQGDERLKWAKTTDGFTLLYNRDGIFEYGKVDSSGDLIPSGIKARNVGERTPFELASLGSVNKGLFYSTIQLSTLEQIWQQRQSGFFNKSFPTTGSRRLICILIGFTDKAFSKLQTDFQNLFNQVGYSIDGATGSVKEYFKESSYNKLDLTVDIAGPFLASNTHSYYGGNDPYGFDERPRELVTEAIQLADPTVNFANYDNDSDGSVDGVYVIFAGYGEEAGGGADCIWSHAWAINPLLCDGKSISSYSCSPELRSNSGSGITRIGVICHEFGHVLGAPDFYDVDYSYGGNYTGTGLWDLQASGSWNNNGATPSHSNPYIKIYYYGWATATTLESPRSITLLDSERSANHFYRINTPTTDEFFLIENRQKLGFDAYLPGHGLMIYHAHKGIRFGNINTTHPQKFYPICAGATSEPGNTPESYGNINSDLCPYPGTASKSFFNDVSTPSSKSWGGEFTNRPIIGITEDLTTKTINLDFMDQNDPTSLSGTTVSPIEIRLNWTKNASNNPVLLAFNTDPVFGVPNNGTDYSIGGSLAGGGSLIYKGSLNEYLATSLLPGKTYYFKIWSILTGNNYSSGIAISCQTACNSISSFPWIETFNAGEIMPDCWSQHDFIGNGQLWQFGTVTGFPVAPQLNGNYAFLNSDAYGMGFTQNVDLISPTFDFTNLPTVFVKFKHYFPVIANSSGTFSYSTDNGQNWTQVAVFTSTANPENFTKLIPDASGKSSVKFKWNYRGTWGWGWCIDDIEVPLTFTHDISTLTIDIPDLVSLGSLTPQARVFNKGANTETFSVTMSALGYASTKVVTSLAPFQEATVVFDAWNISQSGDVSVSVCATLVGDMDPTNNCSNKQVRIKNLNKVVYAYITSTYGTDPVGPAKFLLSSPFSITSLANQSEMDFLRGGTWANGVWYGAVYNSNMLISISPETGARTELGNLGTGIDGLSFNPMNNTMYGVGYDGANSNLFSINMLTGATTLIGKCGSFILINLAIDKDGNGYAVDISNDRFGKVNLNNGAFTTVSSLGFDANFAQDLEFDRQTGDLFYAACTQYEGWLALVDPTNGQMNKIGNFEGEAQITGLAIPYSIVLPPTVQVSNLQFSNNHSSSFTIGWTSGNGTNRVVFVKEGTGQISNPVNNSAYSPSSNWLVKGSQLGTSGYYCVYNGNSNSVDLTGLTPGTTYTVQAFEYNGTVGSETYCITAGMDNPKSISTTTPVLVVIPNSLVFGQVLINNSSAPQSFSVSGSNLIADISVSAPAGFMISLADNSGFTNSLTLTQNGGVVTTATLYARFSPVAPGIYSGNINVASAGATSQPIAVTGNTGGNCVHGWSLVTYTNNMTLYGQVTINGSPATVDDKVGAFVGNECRGIGNVIINNGLAYTTMVVQGNVSESVKFRIWNASTCSEIPASPTITLVPGGTIGYPDFIQIIAPDKVLQTIPLTSNWSLVSLFVKSIGHSPADVFAKAACGVVEVKNMTQSYNSGVPDFLNTLKNLVDGDGYFVRSSNACDGSIEDQLVENNYSMDFVQGWNLKGFPIRSSSGLPGASQVLIDENKLLQIKNTTKSYDPALPDFLNTLKCLNAGEGYFVKVSGAKTGFRWIQATCSGGEPKSGIDLSDWVIKSYQQSTVIYCDITLNGESINLPAYVGVFVKGECRGVSELVFHQGKSYATLVVNGEVMETLEFRLLYNGLVISSSQMLKSNPGNSFEGIVPIDFSGFDTNNILRIKPNPFQHELFIELFTTDNNPVQLSIYSVDGRLIRQFELSGKAGFHNVVWNGQDQEGIICQSGIYLIKAQLTKGVLVKRAILTN